MLSISSTPLTDSNVHNRKTVMSTEILVRIILKIVRLQKGSWSFKWGKGFSLENDILNLIKKKKALDRTYFPTTNRNRWERGFKMRLLLSIWFAHGLITFVVEMCSNIHWELDQQNKKKLNFAFGTNSVYAKPLENCLFSDIEVRRECDNHRNKRRQSMHALSIWNTA